MSTGDFTAFAKDRVNTSDFAIGRTRFMRKSLMITLYAFGYGTTHLCAMS